MKSKVMDQVTPSKANRCRTRLRADYKPSNCCTAKGFPTGTGIRVNAIQENADRPRRGEAVLGENSLDDSLFVTKKPQARRNGLQDWQRFGQLDVGSLV